MIVRTPEVAEKVSLECVIHLLYIQLFRSGHQNDVNQFKQLL